jgi:DNA gyrase subunit A
MEHAHVLIDKQGNFGDRRSCRRRPCDTPKPAVAVAAMMLDDLKLDTVDYIPTYDESAHRADGAAVEVSPTCWSTGPAASRSAWRPASRRTILGEVCDALIALIDDPDVSIDELMEIMPGPDFPTGGIICGRSGIRRGYNTGRSTIVVRARARSKR